MRGQLRPIISSWGGSVSNWNIQWSTKDHPFYLIFPRLITLWSRWSKMRLDSGIIIIPRIWDHEIIMGLADAEALLDKVFYFVFVRVKLVVVELTNALMYIWIFRFILPASFCPFWFVKLTAGSMQHHCSSNKHLFTADHLLSSHFTPGAVI